MFNSSLAASIWAITANTTNTTTSSHALIQATVCDEFGDLMMVGSNNGAQSASGLGTTFVRKYSVPQVLGMSLANYIGSDSNQAVVGANPTNVAALHITKTGADDSTSDLFTFYIRLTYDVEFLGRTREPLSLFERVKNQKTARALYLKNAEKRPRKERKNATRDSELSVFSDSNDEKD